MSFAAVRLGFRFQGDEVFDGQNLLAIVPLIHLPFSWRADQIGAAIGMLQAEALRVGLTELERNVALVRRPCRGLRAGSKLLSFKPSCSSCPSMFDWKATMLSMTTSGRMNMDRQDLQDADSSCSESRSGGFAGVRL